MNTPKTANTCKKLGTLKRDNISTKDFWMLVHTNHITIAKQQSGEHPEFIFNIPKKNFNKMVKFYLGSIK